MRNGDKDIANKKNMRGKHSKRKNCRLKGEIEAVCMGQPIQNNQLWLDES